MRRLSKVRESIEVLRLLRKSQRTQSTTWKWLLQVAKEL